MIYSCNTAASSGFFGSVGEETRWLESTEDGAE